MRCRLVCFIGVLLFISNFAIAQPDPDLVLQQAKDDIATRNLALNGDRFAYSLQLVSTGDEEFNVSLRFDPSLKVDQQWQILSPTKQQNPEIYAETLRQIEQSYQNDPTAKDDHELLVENFAKDENSTYQFLRKEGDLIVYGFDPSQSMSVSDQDGSDAGMGKIGKYLNAELTINAAKGRLASIRIFANKPFKPVVVAKIKKMDILIEFAPAWDGGPLVQVKESVVVSGSAMFQKFSQSVTETYSDFVRQ